MTDARKFDELVSWHAKPVAGVGMGWDPGWRPDGGAFTHNISPSDPYWNTVLDKAQAAYGDPGMRFNTSDPSADRRSEEHTSELQSLMRISYAVFCLKKKTRNKHNSKLYIKTSDSRQKQ